MEKIISTNNMKTSDLKNLTKSQLIGLLIKQNLEMKKLLQQNMQQQPIPTKITEKPIPAPRKSVKQMVQDYEENIILPPIEFRDDYKPTPKPRTKKPVPLLRTKIEEKAQAMKGYTKSYEINIKNNKDPLEQLKTQEKLLKIISKILLNQERSKICTNTQGNIYKNVRWRNNS